MISEEAEHLVSCSVDRNRLLWPMDEEMVMKYGVSKSDNDVYGIVLDTRYANILNRSPTANRQWTLCYHKLNFTRIQIQSQMTGH